jgi:hypothetical protein
MALKKNDKIIAIAGVLILIIAAVSIVVLYSPEKEVENAISEEKTFYVTWEENTEVIPISGHVGKKTPYTEPITVTAPSTNLVGVLTHVEIQLTWKDAVTYRGILSKGLDKLTANIYPTGSESSEAVVTTGQGNFSMPFEINSVPMLNQVTATDIDAANSKIQGNFSGKDTASFDTELTIKYGEKLRRPLKFLKEKGDDFKLTITYTYYYPVITEATGDDGNTYEETPAETAHQALMITTGYGIHW